MSYLAGTVLAISHVGAWTHSESIMGASQICGARLGCLKKAKNRTKSYRQYDGIKQSEFLSPFRFYFVIYYVEVSVVSFMNDVYSM